MMSLKILNCAVIGYFAVIVFVADSNAVSRNEFQRVRDHQQQQQYVYQHVQTGSARWPQPDTRIRVYPNATASHITRMEQTMRAGATSRKSFDRLLRTRPTSANHHNICFRCPPERIVVAKKGVDGVLIELPPVTSCTNRILHQYTLETLFGAQLQFVLPQGTHSFVGRIVNRRTGTVEHICTLRYVVMVQQCQRYMPKNHDLKLRCDMANIWGSTCAFQCRNSRRTPSHRRSVVCDDNLMWHGAEEPHCRDAVAANVAAACEALVPPNNGQLLCEMNETHSNDINVAPIGSVCRVHCNRPYNVRTALADKTVFTCTASGQWNATMVDFCQLQP